MAAKLVVAVVVVALDGRVLDRPVHPPDLTIRPRMVRLGQPMLNPVGLANHVEPHWPRDVGVPISRLLGELDPVVRQDRVDLVRHGVQKQLQEFPGRLSVRLFHQLRHGELAGSVNGHEEIELAFCSPQLGDVDMKEADGLAIGQEPMAPSMARRLKRCFFGLSRSISGKREMPCR